MTRAIVIAAAIGAGLATGVGCSVFCADCNCGPGTAEVRGTVTAADRAELVGAIITINGQGLTLDYTRSDGTTWTVTYSPAP